MNIFEMIIGIILKYIIGLVIMSGLLAVGTADTLFKPKDTKNRFKGTHMKAVIIMSIMYFIVLFTLNIVMNMSSISRPIQYV